MSKTQVFYLCILVVLCISFVSCGRENNQPDNNDEYDEIVDHGPQPGLLESLPDGPILLRIATHPQSGPVIRRAALALQRELAEQDINFDFSITIYNTGYFRVYDDPDIMFSFSNYFYHFSGNIHDYDLLHLKDIEAFNRYARAGYLADIDTLISADPSLTRWDFFTDVLDSFMSNGGLHILPLGFYLEFIGINTATNMSYISATLT